MNTREPFIMKHPEETKEGRYFKATETEENIYPILNRLMSDMEPLSMRTGDVGVCCGGRREIFGAVVLKNFSLLLDSGALRQKIQKGAT